VALKGDVPAGEFYWGTGCWNSAEQETFKVLRHCTTTISEGTCAVVAGTAVGTIDACHADVAQTPPDADENVDTQESGSPDGTLAPPTAMPTMDGI
jgi:hypothetical protein